MLHVEIASNKLLIWTRSSSREVRIGEPSKKGERALLGDLVDQTNA